MLKHAGPQLVERPGEPVVSAFLPLENRIQEAHELIKLLPLLPQAHASQGKRRADKSGQCAPEFGLHHATPIDFSRSRMAEIKPSSAALATRTCVKACGPVTPP